MVHAVSMTGQPPQAQRPAQELDYVLRIGGAIGGVLKQRRDMSPGEVPPGP
jgi:hypothetical protein